MDQDLLIQAVTKQILSDAQDRDFTAISEMFEMLLNGENRKEATLILMGFLGDDINQQFEEGSFVPLW